MVCHIHESWRVVRITVYSTKDAKLNNKEIISSCVDPCSNITSYSAYDSMIGHMYTCTCDIKSTGYKSINTNLLINNTIYTHVYIN